MALVCPSTSVAEVVSRKSMFIERTRDLARSAAGPDGSFHNRLMSAYQAVVALGSVDSLHTLNADQVCASVIPVVTDDMHLETAYHATHILSRLRCLNQKASSAAASIAMQHLASADSVSTAYQSISILSTLHKAKTLVKRVGADQIERVIMLFKDLSDSQGRFKPSSTSPRRSILATGLVYRTLADARSLETSLSPDIEETVEEMRASLAQVLKGGKMGQALLALPGDEDKVQAASQLVIGAAAIYDGSVPSVSASQLSNAAQLLGGAYHVGSLADAAAVGPALKALVESALPQPLLATMASPRIKGSQQDSVVITVKNAWGSPAAAGSVTVHSSAADASGKGKATPNGPQTLQSGSSTGEYLYSTADLHDHPGTYKLTVNVEDSAGSPAGQSELSLTVSYDVQLDSVTVAFSEGEIQGSINETLPYPQAMATQSATLDPSQTLKVSLAMSASHSGSSFVPQQRMLRLTSQKSKSAAYFNLKPSKVKEQSYTITVTPNAIDKQIGGQDGTYSIDLLIGDSAIDVPVQWALGTVAVSHQDSDDRSQLSLTATHALFQAKPEIVHIHRVPGRRPPSVVSVLFTLLALAPLLLLFVMLSSIGANLKGFPRSGPALVAAVAFHGGIASILGLYTLFWLKLNLIQTLPILLVLGIFTTIAGYNALSQQADFRLKQQ